MKLLACVSQTRGIARACVVVCAGTLTVAAGTRSATQIPAAKTYTVTIEGMRFNPQTLTVHRGDRLVWINRDLFPHTATADSKAFDSGSIAPNVSWTYRARRVGEFDYGCTFHPTMRARLVVESRAKAPVTRANRAGTLK